MDPALTQVRRLPEKQRYERADLDAVLDASVLAHIGFADPGQGHPVVVPLAHVRVGDRLLVHGSTGSRAFRALAAGAPACLTVTVLDALIYARSVFESSMRYRSAMVFGRFELVPDEEHVDALRAFSDHVMPGHWDRARPPSRKELAATSVLALPLGAPTQWSVKVSDGWPEDDPADLDRHTWAGVLPAQRRWAAPQPAPDLAAGVGLPGYVRRRTGQPW